ncbi:MAG: hypothetical protein ABW079_17610, partial [Sedimenticola sp.]
MQLVLRTDTIIATREEEARALAKQSDWSGKVRLGYSHLSTRDEAQGLNAGVTVEIPLFSRKREIEAARSRRAVAESRQKVRSGFLSEAAKLDELEAKRFEAEEMAAFYSDRLAYFRKAVEEGRIESDTLWSDAEKAKKAEHDHRQGEVKLQAA